MAESQAARRWRPSRTTLVAGAIVIAGLLLTEISWWFLILVGLGTFGPGILREFGWLHDKDEFQLRAAYRAGYHAFLVCGLAAFVLVAFFRSGERAVENPEELATAFLALLWFSWLFSSLLSYWGPQKTAARILIVFGLLWLVFTVVSNLGSEWTGWTALLMQPLLTLPFFFLAWLSRRWPRVTGILLILASVFFFRFFGMFEDGIQGMINDGLVFMLFIGPLLASGVALLGVKNRGDDLEEAEDMLVTGS